MFNFKDLDIEKNTNAVFSSFVGIKKDSQTDRMTFYLPKGFEDFEISYNNVKRFFFSMYKTFKVFEIDNASNFERMLDKEGRNRDNTSLKDYKGYNFSQEDNDNEILLYSKIDIIDSFFKVHQELDIDSIVQKFGYTEDVDYSNIENLFNEGVFLKNDAIFINDSVSEKNVIESSITELVEIYCYIYKELLIELDIKVSPIISEVADSFSYRYLTSLQSLFEEDTYEITILILKDCLDSIDKKTAYKDYLYCDIYEVVENFLFGRLNLNDNEGVFWGINNFSYIWEDICNSYMLSDTSRKIFYCDSSLKRKNINLIHKNLLRKKFGGQSVYIDKEYDNNFYIEMNGYKRWIRPDIVITNESHNNIIDEFKSSNIISFSQEKLNHKLFGDIGKINVSIKVDYSSVNNEQELINAKKIFNYFKHEFSSLKYSGHHSYNKAKGHQFVEVTEKYIKLKNIAKDVFDEIYNRKNKGEKDDNVYIIDWKYVPLSFFSKQSEKLKIDVIKQLTYEFCITQGDHIKNGTISQFCIPKFSKSNRLVLEKHKGIIPKSNIQVVSLNFDILQSEYLNRNTVIS